MYSSYLPGHTVSSAGENISSEVTSAVRFFTIEASHELGKQDAKVISTGIPLDIGLKIKEDDFALKLKLSSNHIYNHFFPKFEFCMFHIKIFVKKKFKCFF